MIQNEKIDTVCSTQRIDLVFTIFSRGKGETVLDVLRENKILQNTSCQGRGTAPSSILEMLGLGATEKDIVLSFVKKEKSGDIIKKISEKLVFSRWLPRCSTQIIKRKRIWELAHKYAREDCSVTALCKESIGA